MFFTRINYVIQLIKSFRSVESKFSSATAGIEKFTRKFEKAAQDAEAEIKQLETDLSNQIDKLDAEIEKAYEKYMQKEAEAAAKISKSEAFAAKRTAELAAISAKAQTAINNFRSIYLS